MFSDTLFAGSVLRQGNKMAQAYATSFGWAHAHPMKRKEDAHETLSLVLGVATIKSPKKNYPRSCIFFVEVQGIHVNKMDPKYF
jgi:hypothetical protein